MFLTLMYNNCLYLEGILSFQSLLFLEFKMTAGLAQRLWGRGDWDGPLENTGSKMPQFSFVLSK